MNNKAGIIRELRKALEFYSELGLEYLPVNSADISDHLSKISDVIHGRDVLSGLIPEQTGENKAGAVKNLREEIGDCRRCKLSECRNNIVFGEGSPDAALMFRGEGPGRDEDIQARPFVGDAGKLLTKLIVKLGLKREEV